MKNNLIVRALQEAQDIFGVDFDFDEFGYGEEDEFEEEDEVSLIPESAQSDRVYMPREMRSDKDIFT